MRALTFRQPWAHAVVALPEELAKRIDNRKRVPPASWMGKWFAVHAGNQFDLKSWPWPSAVEPPAMKDCPRGMVLGVARLRGWFATQPRLHYQFASYDDCNDVVNMPGNRWWLGPVGLLLGDVVALKRPVVCGGRLGYWRLPPDVESVVLTRLLDEFDVEHEMMRQLLED